MPFPNELVWNPGTVNSSPFAVDVEGEGLALPLGFFKGGSRAMVGLEILAGVGVLYRDFTGKVGLGVTVQAAVAPMLTTRRNHKKTIFFMASGCRLHGFTNKRFQLWSPRM